MTRTMQRQLYAAFKAGALDAPKTGAHAMTTLEVNHREPCRICRGARGHQEPTDRPDVTIFEPCYACHGSGKQTMEIGCTEERS